MSGTRKPVIFISYSHQDEPDPPRPDEPQWLSLVVGYLRAAFPNDGAEIWLDRLMPGGTDFNAEIERKLAKCDAFVLLVSHHSLSSKYVVEKEIAAIQARQAKGEKVLFYPILLTPTPKAALKLIDDRIMRPTDGKPLSGFSAHERMRYVNEAADEIAELVGRAETSPTEIVLRADLQSRDELRDWFRGKPRDVVLAIAVRAALRVLPLYRSSRATHAHPNVKRHFANWTLMLFRATAFARVAINYPTQVPKDNENFAASAAYAAESAAAGVDVYPTGTPVEEVYAYAAAPSAARAAARVAAAVNLGYRVTPPARALRAAAMAAEDAARAAYVAADARAGGAGPFAREAADVATDYFWRTVSADAEAAIIDGSTTLIDLPLWPAKVPAWAESAWSEMNRLLPYDQNWEVWRQWYEERLHGRRRSEGYELAFADWPNAIWKQGPKIVNANILERLAALAPDLPDAVPGLEAPVTFDWNARRRLESISGAQNFPLFAHASSEEDRRKSLEVCRVGARRLLSTLRDNRLFNVAPAYEFVLADYIEYLPATTGSGNILLARDRALILAAMLQRDAGELPDHFAIQLQRVIDNQRALDPFYDLVQRHDEAVAKSKWQAPFPLEAAKDVIDKVSKNTEIFEVNVGADLTRVEQAAPPEAPPPAAPAEKSSPSPTPDLVRSHQRQVGTSINAMWGAFLRGPQVIGASHAWSEVGHSLADSVGQVLDWLRSLGA